MQRTFLFALAVLAARASLVAAQNPREQKVRADRDKVEADGFWDVGRGRQRL